jgi:hypothetical protein
MNIDRYEAFWAYDSAFETRSWVEKIPAIKFPQGWEVQIIPPFGGALCRFRVNGIVSVYLDGYDLLGYCREPYWEVYPHEDDVFRCGMNEIDKLIEAIQESLNAKQ